MDRKIPVTPATKKELLAPVREIGMALTNLESQCYTHKVATEQVKALRYALEVVRAAIATHPEP